MNKESTKRFFRFTPGRASVIIAGLLEAAERYLSIFHNDTIYGKYLEPYFLDKAVHFSAFYGTAEIVDELLHRKVKRKKLRQGLVISTATAAGVAKEFSDILGGTYFDPLDMIANYAGTFYYFWRKRNER